MKTPIPLNEGELRFAAAVLLIVLLGLFARHGHLRARRATEAPTRGNSAAPAVQRND